MSWDIWMDYARCSHCGRGDLSESMNYTHNTNPMIRKALEAVGTLDALGEDHLYALDGMTGAAAYELLGPAMEWWEKNHEAMHFLSPSNGWGSEKGAYDFWNWVTQLCKQHPAGTLRVSG